jgi:hypothetical protein
MFRLVMEPSSGLFLQDKRYTKCVNIGIPLLITHRQPMFLKEQRTLLLLLLLLITICDNYYYSVTSMTL